MSKTLRISVPCNWKNDLLDEIESDEKLLKVVNDFYGTRDLGFTGSGRPFFIMVNKDYSEMEDYINRIHDMGLGFTWLWNGKCVGFKKFDREQQTQALKELDWLDDLGVEYITIVDPYLARFVRHYHPKIKIKVSLIAEVTTLSMAYDWQDIIGKEGIINLSVMVNRNFPLLRKFKENLDCDLELLLNDACVHECPFRFFHYSETAHASQEHHLLKGYYNDWSVIACQSAKAFNPEQIMMAKWIQPSDMDYYLQTGIDYYKISGRRYDTPWIMHALKAYANRFYKDNLGNMLNGYNFQTNPLELAGSQFSTYTSLQEELGGYQNDEDLQIGIPDFDAHLKCDKLGEFIENLPFEGSRCIENCGITCKYCFDFVDKAYFLPSAEKKDRYKKYSAYMYNYVNAGQHFVPKEERTVKNPLEKKDEGTLYGVPWSFEAEMFFKDTLDLIPESMQKSASKAIKNISERTAERQNEKEVTKDLIIAILIKLVPPQFQHDLLDLLIEKNIDTSKFLTQEEKEAIESQPYSYEITDAPKEIPEDVVPSKKNEEDWKDYLQKFMIALNELSELQSLIPKLSPLIIEYKISDDSRMNFWQGFIDSRMDWGFGDYSGSDVPIMVHKTTFDTIQNVLSGTTDPIKATMDGKYTVEGNTEKLMECVPLINLYANAHKNCI
ncbi:MAG: hypothetical protein GF317_16430 [Candidatus Lokiarchaeota archaeon]|nr:hypothetical protein [Candidatus Lokiarchaeota archaeon]MBD3201122.1 hypothetical protein [Candidatus Lokiarchaeota archaeon]